MSHSMSKCPDCEAKDARIAELERHLENSGMYGNAGRYWEGRWRDEHTGNGRLLARISELEAYHTNCTDHINGLLGNMADDDKERVAILARAERAEAEALKAKAHIAALCDAMVYSDSYGVQGSEFQCCHACSAGGAPNVVFKHDEHCPVGKAEASAAEWWDDYKAAEEDRERAEAELAALRKNAPEWFAALRKIEAERDAMRKVLEAFCYAGRDELNDCASDLWAKAHAALNRSPAGREG